MCVQRPREGSASHLPSKSVITVYQRPNKEDESAQYYSGTFHEAGTQKTTRQAQRAPTSFMLFVLSCAMLPALGARESGRPEGKKTSSGIMKRTSGAMQSVPNTSRGKKHGVQNTLQIELRQQPRPKPVQAALQGSPWVQPFGIRAPSHHLSL